MQKLKDRIEALKDKVRWYEEHCYQMDKTLRSYDYYSRFSQQGLVIMSKEQQVNREKDERLAREVLPRVQLQLKQAKAKVKTQEKNVGICGCRQELSNLITKIGGDTAENDKILGFFDF